MTPCPLVTPEANTHDGSSQPIQREQNTAPDGQQYVNRVHAMPGMPAAYPVAALPVRSPAANENNITFFNNASGGTSDGGGGGGPVVVMRSYGNQQQQQQQLVWQQASDSDMKYSMPQHQQLPSQSYHQHHQQQPKPQPPQAEVLDQQTV